MHGGSDRMVPLSKSQMLERALKDSREARWNCKIVPRGQPSPRFSGLASLQVVGEVSQQGPADCASDEEHEKGDEDVKLLATYMHQASGQMRRLNLNSIETGDSFRRKV